MNDEIGKRYDQLTVIADTGRKYHSTRIYLCRCDCVKEVEVDVNKLHSGRNKSCGCLKLNPLGILLETPSVGFLY